MAAAELAVSLDHQALALQYRQRPLKPSFVFVEMLGKGQKPFMTCSCVYARDLRDRDQKQGKVGAIKVAHFQGSAMNPSPAAR